MWWMISGVVAVLVGLWLASPALSTFLRPAFEPSRRNDAIVFQAQQSGHP